MTADHFETNLRRDDIELIGVGPVRDLLEIAD